MKPKKGDRVRVKDIKALGTITYVHRPAGDHVDVYTVKLDEPNNLGLESPYWYARDFELEAL